VVFYIPAAVGGRFEAFSIGAKTYLARGFGRGRWSIALCKRRRRAAAGESAAGDAARALQFVRSKREWNIDEKIESPRLAVPPERAAAYGCTFTTTMADPEKAAIRSLVNRRACCVPRSLGADDSRSPADSPVDAQWTLWLHTPFSRRVRIRNRHRSRSSCKIGKGCAVDWRSIPPYAW